MVASAGGMTVEQLQTIRAAAQALLTLTDKMIKQDLPVMTENLVLVNDVNKEWKTITSGK